MRQFPHMVRRTLSCVVFSACVLPAVASVDSAAAAGPATIELEGRGYGHGVGLSQWGAYGYAVDYGWSAERILDHFYGGTVAATVPPQPVTVRLLTLDGLQTAVVHDKGQLIVDGVAGGPWKSVVVREVSPSAYSVWVRADRTACPSGTDSLGGWTLAASAIGPTVVVRPTTDTSASADYADLLAVCEPDGTVRSYRGFIRAVNASDGANRTVNEVTLEQYLRSVVAGEVSWGWATAGGGRGAQALRAQAVAARSYGLAENRAPWAKTCDLTYCQTYRGAARRSSLGGSFTAIEHPLIDAAVTSTAGIVRKVGSTSGPIAYTMFSSSSGGHTAVTTLPFTAVPDLGDATAANPHHTWRTSLDTAIIERAYPTIGDFTRIEVGARDGAGEWGGRVTSVTLVGRAATVTVSGSQFRSATRLKSNWFRVVGATTPPDADCAGRVPPPVVSGAATSVSGTGYRAVTPTRVANTRNGLGVPLGRLPGGCTLVVNTGQVGAKAVALNVTAVRPLATGFLTAYQCGTARPDTSVLQPLADSTVGGASIVAVDAAGRVCLYSNVSTDIIVDLVGRYDATGASYRSIAVSRRLDTRGGARHAATTTRVVQIAGVGAVSAGASAVTATVHASDPLGRGFVTLFACGSPLPNVATINAMPGVALANHAHVPLSSQGALCVYSSVDVHVTIDVSGWFGGTASARFTVMPPTRVADSRRAFGVADRLVGLRPVAVQLAGANQLPEVAAIHAVAAQVVAVGPSATGYLTVYPCTTSAPPVSMNRFIAGGSAATLVTSAVSSVGQWCVLSSAATDVVVDVTGFYTG
jgi:SpoIID/LytB domain protein